MKAHSVSLLRALPCALPWEAEETPGVEVIHETENPYYGCAIICFSNSLANQNTEKKIFRTSQRYLFLTLVAMNFFLVQTIFFS